MFMLSTLIDVHLDGTERISKCIKANYLTEQTRVTEKALLLSPQRLKLGGLESDY